MYRGPRNRWLGVLAVLVVSALASGGRDALQALERQAQCDEVQALVARQNLFNDSTAASGPRVAFLGDSYTAASQAAQVESGWAVRLAEQRGWQPILLGFGGSGFSAPGPCGDDSFQTRYDDVVAAAPDAVIIQGGYNDRGTPASTERDLIVSGVRHIQAELPGVPVLLVGPAAPSAEVLSQVAPVAEAFRAASAETEVPLIDPASWFTAENRGRLISPDGVHPNGAGYAYLARRIDDRIGSWGPAVTR